MKLFVAAALAVIISVPACVSGQEYAPDRVTTVRARVVEVFSGKVGRIDNSADVNSVNQMIRAEILEGEKIGSIVDVENDYVRLKRGETFYLRHTVDVNGTEFYSVADPYRLPLLFGLIALFVIMVAVFGGTQGIRGLASLLGGLLLIVFVLLPGIMRGLSPVFLAIGVASLVIGVGSYITHGFNRTTSAAVIGMIATISITGALALFSISYGRLTGLETEEAVYLNFNTGGSIDLAGLLLGGILIGLLGVLYDVAIGQAVAVEEIKRAGENLSSGEVYKRALRIGREHTGALVNSLAIAYVGVSLPLLLLFYNTGLENVFLNMNREIFATEIVRTMVGSIGLVLAVPVTTLIAVWMLTGKEKSHSHTGHSHV